MSWPVSTGKWRRVLLRSCLVILVLGVGSETRALAQTPVVVRAVAASLGGNGDVLTTQTVGIGAGIELSEYLEVFGEFTQSVGTVYPPADNRGVAPPGAQPVSVEFLFLEWARHDRLVLGGGRISTSRFAPVRAFAEVGGGTMRLREVFGGRQGLATWTSHVPLVTVGGGVAAHINRLELEAGYRVRLWRDDFGYGRANGFHVAAGLRF